MTNPYLPNPSAALETSAELSNVGQRISDAMESAVGQINAVGDPWGGDEVGNAYRASIGDTQDIQQVLLSLGKGVNGFGSVATAAIQRITDIDEKHGRNLGDIRI